MYLQKNGKFLALSGSEGSLANQEIPVRNNKKDTDISLCSLLQKSTW